MEKREIDKEICEKILGWTELEWREAVLANGTTHYESSSEGWYGKGPENKCYLSKPPSQDIGTAHEVIKTLCTQRSLSFSCGFFTQPGYQIKFSSGVDRIDNALPAIAGHDFPLVVCKAALAILDATEVTKRVACLEKELIELRGIIENGFRRGGR